MMALHQWNWAIPSKPDVAVVEGEEGAVAGVAEAPGERLSAGAVASLGIFVVNAVCVFLPHLSRLLLSQVLLSQKTEGGADFAVFIADECVWFSASCLGWVCVG